MTDHELNPLPRRSETAVRAEEGCDWGQCDREPDAGAFCSLHADEWERVQQAKADEWWSG